MATLYFLLLLNAAQDEMTEKQNLLFLVEFLPVHYQITEQHFYRLNNIDPHQAYPVNQAHLIKLIFQNRMAP